MIKEFDGRTEEEAVKKAMAELEAKDFEYELITEGKRSLFKKPLVKIRVYLDEDTLEPISTSNDTLDKLDSIRDKEEDGLVELSSFDKLTETEEWVVNFVKNLTKLMGLNLEVKVSQRSNGGKHYLELNSPDEALIIGKGGERLDALQTLVSAAFYMAHPDSEERYILDVDGYRRMKVETVVKSARASAKKVHETGRSVLLEPLNAYERREVHKMVNTFGDLASESEGHGVSKRIRIFKVK